jgi:hypothetical protein
VSKSGKQEMSVPLRNCMRCGVSTGFFYRFCISSAMMHHVYFVAIYFQAIQGFIAYESKTRCLPLVLALVIGSALSCSLVSAAIYCTPLIILGIDLMVRRRGLSHEAEEREERGRGVVRSNELVKSSTRYRIGRETSSNIFCFVRVFKVINNVFINT